MPLQNFVAKTGPAISAVWLNAVDVLKFTIFGDATTPAQARTNLTLDAPLEVANGGTGTRGSGASFLSFLASFFPSLYQYINPLTPAEITVGVTSIDYAYLPLNVLRYLADPTGVADSLAAFNTASLVANTGGGGTITAPSGTFKLTGTPLFYTAPNLGKVILQGAGRAATVLNYTGSAAGFGVSAASTRIYDCGIRDLTILNGGTGTVGLDLDSVSTSNFEHVTISGFPTARRLHSTITGGCVYNRFFDVTAQMNTSAVVGFLTDAKGSNATEDIACRYNGPNNTVGIAWKIVDANGCSVIGCNIDQALVGYDLSAPSGAGFCDGNVLFANRNEGVDTIYSLAANVRFTQIVANYHQAYNTLIVDNGSRNNFLSPPNSAFEKYTAPGQATGNKRIENTSDIGANPFVVVQDTATTTAGSTVVQVETSSVNQVPLRLRLGGVDKFSFSATGGFGMFGTAAVAAKPSVTGAKGGNAALTSLLTALAAYGLFTDNTT